MMATRILQICDKCGIRNESPDIKIDNPAEMTDVLILIGESIKAAKILCPACGGSPATPELVEGERRGAASRGN